MLAHSYCVEIISITKTPLPRLINVTWALITWHITLMTIAVLGDQKTCVSVMIIRKFIDHRHILWIPQSGRPTPLGLGDIKVKYSDYQHTHIEMCVSAWRTCLRKCLGFIYYWTHPFALIDEYFAGPHKSFICGAMHGTQKFQQAWINQVAVMFGTRDRLFYLFCGARALFLTRVFQNFAAHMCTCYSSIV